jgi:hypothetical protein
MTSRGGRHKLPEAIGGTIRAELSRLGGPSAGSASGLSEVWAEVAGPVIAANAWPARVARDGTLVVHTSSSVWAYELAQMEEAIRARFGDLAPPKLAFVVGPLPSPGPETAPKAEQVVHRAGPLDREKAAEIARVIEDPELRHAVARAVETGLARYGEKGGATGPSDRLQEA